MGAKGTRPQSSSRLVMTGRSEVVGIHWRAAFSSPTRRRGRQRPTVRQLQRRAARRPATPSSNAVTAPPARTASRGTGLAGRSRAKPPSEAMSPSGAVLPGTVRLPSHSAATTTGSLTRNSARQPSDSETRPPTVVPAIVPSGIIVATEPTAVPRRSGATTRATIGR